MAQEHGTLENRHQTRPSANRQIMSQKRRPWEGFSSMDPSSAIACSIYGSHLMNGLKENCILGKEYTILCNLNQFCIQKTNCKF